MTVDKNDTIVDDDVDEQIESQLTEIQITTGNIQSIGTDSFADLQHLEQLSLSKNHINFIHSYAFRMNKPSNLTLMIDLTDNDLNSSSFVPESFIGAKRFIFEFS
ncbi:slit protein-like protein [Euroglyphus maynei]|uniref:Slit protein-like protein n=1 Tax=Euroglyphus maynei TaxID=6958 RepID=A0A1Y3AR05_EURMA|nr:slit protein-like protein [Euroglyphus maynei]